MEERKTIIRLEKATKTYTDGNKVEIKALNDLTLEIHEGEMIAITGPSGSGKSTLLHVLSGIEKLTKGEYFWNETEITEMKDKEYAKLRNTDIGIIMQDYGLLLSESVLVNVCLPGIIGNRCNKAMRKRAIEILEGLGLKGIEKKAVSQLSGGEKQRVAIARCLLMDAKLILADEPTGSLDSDKTMEIIQVFRKLNDVNKKTIVIVTHDNRVAAECPIQWHMVDGKIIEE